MTPEFCIKKYNRFSNIFGFAPAATIEEARALFVVAVGTYLSVVRARFDHVEIEKAILHQDAQRHSKNGVDIA